MTETQTATVQKNWEMNVQAPGSIMDLYGNFGFAVKLAGQAQREIGPLAKQLDETKIPQLTVNVRGLADAFTESEHANAAKAGIIDPIVEGIGEVTGLNVRGRVKLVFLDAPETDLSRSYLPPKN
jgi:hypothetical protein